MLVNQLVRFCFSASKLCLAALLLSAALATGVAQAGEVPGNVPIVKKANRTVATGNRMLANGTHLYGETDRLGALGKEYVVFDHQGGQAIGAVFLAGSEYSCFSGQVHGDQLKMMVLDTYEEVERPYAISLDGTAGESGNNDLEYRPVSEIGKQEISILDACRSFYRERFSRLSIRG